MAFNLQTFKTRALTAILFAIVMLGGILYNQWSFFALFSFIHFGCWLEYQKLVKKIDPDYNQTGFFNQWIVAVAGWGFMLAMTNREYAIGDISFTIVGWWLLVMLLISFLINCLFFPEEKNLKTIIYSITGLFYISVCWGLMIDIRTISIKYFSETSIQHPGWLIPLMLIISIWINDTMAYIVGSFIGKTPFSKISPKKTWEGTAGGALLAVIVVTLCGYFLFNINDIPLLTGISAIAAIAGTAGDLLESKLKRMAGVKDSGNILPGHGGFLDRFDSLLLAVPFAWLFLKFILL